MELRQTAIHEAAHAVIAHVLGLACKSIALTHDAVDDTGAFGLAVGPNPIYGYRGTSRSERSANARDECVACCAGLAAEHVFFGVLLDAENENAQDDFRNIIILEKSGFLRTRRKYGDGFAGDGVTWKFIKRKLREAHRLVYCHRETIDRLADELLQRGPNGKLEAGEVERLLKDWTSQESISD